MTDLLAKHNIAWAILIVIAPITLSYFNSLINFFDRRKSSYQQGIDKILEYYLLYLEGGAKQQVYEYCLVHSLNIRYKKFITLKEFKHFLNYENAHELLAIYANAKKYLAFINGKVVLSRHSKVISLLNFSLYELKNYILYIIFMTIGSMVLYLTYKMEVGLNISSLTIFLSIIAITYAMKKLNKAVDYQYAREFMSVYEHKNQLPVDTQAELNAEQG